jgi:hypothetical protein
VWKEGKSDLDRVITMDESPMTMYTMETRQQSRQWFEKGVAAFVVAKVHDTRMKTMVLAYLTPRAEHGVQYN